MYMVVVSVLQRGGKSSADDRRLTPCIWGQRGNWRARRTTPVQHPDIPSRLRAYLGERSNLGRDRCGGSIQFLADRFGHREHPRACVTFVPMGDHDRVVPCCLALRTDVAAIGGRLFWGDDGERPWYDARRGAVLHGERGRGRAGSGVGVGGVAVGTGLSVTEVPQPRRRIAGRVVGEGGALVPYWY